MHRIGLNDVAGKCSIGKRDGQLSLDGLSKNSTKCGKRVILDTKHETEYNLQGHVTAHYKAPNYLEAMQQHYSED